MRVKRGDSRFPPHQQGALQLTKSVCKPTGAYSREPSTKLTNYTTTIINISDIKVEKYKKCGLVCSISLGGVTRSRRAQRWCTMTATGARRRYINSASPHDVLTSPMTSRRRRLGNGLFIGRLRSVASSDGPPSIGKGCCCYCCWMPGIFGPAGLM